MPDRYLESKDTGTGCCQTLNSLIDGGVTKNRREMPPIENPMSCVDITSIH